MEKKSFLILIISIVGVVGVTTYYFAMRKAQLSPAPYPSPTSTVTPVSSTSSTNQQSIATSTLAPIKPQIYLGGQSLDNSGDYDVDNLAITVVPIFQMSPVNEVGHSPNYDLVQYRWDDLDFSFNSDALIVTDSNGNELVDENTVWQFGDEYVTGVFTFNYASKQYFLLEGVACGNKCGESEFSLYVLENNNLTRIGPSSPASLLAAADNDIEIGGVIVSQGDLDLIIIHGTSRTAIVMDKSDSLVGEVTGNSQTGVSPTGILPPLIEGYLKSSRG